MATLVPMTAFPQANEDVKEVTSSVAETAVVTTQHSSGENNQNSAFSKNSNFQTSPNVDTNFEVQVQTRFNEIRRELLDEQAFFIDRWLNVISIVLTFFGVVIVIAGIFGFKIFREIQKEAKHHLQEIRKIREKADAEFSYLDANFTDANPTEAYQSVTNIRGNPDASLVEKVIADAVSLQQQGKQKDAIKKWRAIAEITEASDNELAARAWVSIGYLSSDEDVADKLSYYDRAIELNPDLAVAYFNRGNAKRRLGQHEDAIADFDQAIKLDPNQADAYSNRGNVKGRMERHEDAIADFDKAIKLDPDQAEAYSNRGVVKRRLGHHEDAIADFDKAIKLNPDLAEAYNNRGISKSDLEHHEDAIADFDKAIHHDPNIAEAYSSRGSSNYKLGFKVEAKSDFETALRLARISDNVALIKLVEQSLHSLNAINGD